MNKLWVLLLVIFCFGFMPQKKTRVVLFGDSITEMGVKPGGYITVLDSLAKAEKLSDAYEFIGAGIGGNKIYDLYLRMEDDVLKKQPDVVVIYIGVNDVWHKRTFGTGTDPDKFEKFYNAIIKKLKDNNIKVILCTPAVIGEKTDFSNPLDGDLNAYSTLVRKIANQQHLQLVDLRQLFLDYNKKNNADNKEQGILTYDKVHLNAKGNQLVAAAMWTVLKQK